MSLLQHLVSYWNISIKLLRYSDMAPLKFKPHGILFQVGSSANKKPKKFKPYPAKCESSEEKEKGEREGRSEKRRRGKRKNKEKKERGKRQEQSVQRREEQRRKKNSNKKGQRKEERETSRGKRGDRGGRECIFWPIVGNSFSPFTWQSV